MRHLLNRPTKAQKLRVPIVTIIVAFSMQLRLQMSAGLIVHRNPRNSNGKIFNSRCDLEQGFTSEIQMIVHTKTDHILHAFVIGLHTLSS